MSWAGWRMQISWRTIWSWPWVAAVIVAGLMLATTPVRGETIAPGDEKVLAFEDFETGAFQEDWVLRSTRYSTANPEGVPVAGSEQAIRIRSDYGPRGEYHLLMDDPDNDAATTVLNEITLTLDITDYEAVTLDFWEKDLGDDANFMPQAFIDQAKADGVAVGVDGWDLTDPLNPVAVVYWYKLKKEPADPSNPWIELSEEQLGYGEFVGAISRTLADNGVYYPTTIYLRFQQYDELAIPDDGMALDDIRVVGTKRGVTVAVADSTCTEGSGDAAVTITMTGTSTNPIAVAYATAEGTAKVGTDFAGVNGILTWKPGETGNQTVTVPILDDAVYEEDETFTLDLTAVNPADVTNGIFAFTDAVATVTIMDNDSQPQLFIVDTTVSENVGTAYVAVTIRGLTAATVTVGYLAKEGVLNGTTAQAATADVDFTAVTGQLTWGAGDQQPQFIGVPVVDDAAAEGTEAFIVDLMNASHAGIGRGRAGVVIHDNDPPTVGFVPTTVSVKEGDGVADLSVTMVGRSDYRVTATCQTRDLTALSTSDYGATTARLTWEAGEATATKSFTVPISDDTAAPVHEPDETLEVVITSVTNALVLVPGDVATVTIIDNDKPVLQVQDLSVSEKKPASDDDVTAYDVNVTVVAQGKVGTPVVTVDYEVVAGTATLGKDFAVTAPTGTLTFASNWTNPEQTITLTIVDDKAVEADETILIVLSNPVNGVFVDENATSVTGVVTILDNEPRPLLTSADVTVSEDAGAASVVVTMSLRAEATTVAVSLGYATVDGTATAPADYTALSGTLTWPVGEIGDQIIAIPIVNDKIKENDETLSLVLSSPVGGAFNGDDTQTTLTVTVTILDDDSLPSVSVGDVTVNESDQVATVPVAMLGGSMQAITVSYRTYAATAGEPFDYKAVRGTLTWAANTSFDPAVNPDAAIQNVIVPIIDDLEVENAETFTIKLVSVSVNATIGDDSGTVTILDDDADPVVYRRTVRQELLGNDAQAVASRNAYVIMAYNAAGLQPAYTIEYGGTGKELWVMVTDEAVAGTLTVTSVQQGASYFFASGSFSAEQGVADLSSGSTSDVALTKTTKVKLPRSLSGALLGVTRATGEVVTGTVEYRYDQARTQDANIGNRRTAEEVKNDLVDELVGHGYVLVD